MDLKIALALVEKILSDKDGFGNAKIEFQDQEDCEVIVDVERCRKESVDALHVILKDFPTMSYQFTDYSEIKIFDLEG